jgi:diguanylate cyclase (GGDEF)-like protein
MRKNSDFNILIVDDEIFNIEVVEGFLEDEGYRLSHSTNPITALKLAFEHNFDLILLDINMPKLDGIEFCKKLKNDAKTKDIPVIFLSAFSDTQTITNAFHAGGVDYLTKPFNGLELIARVNTHIKLRAYILEVEEKQAKLAQIVATDQQTGLPNRLRFISIIKKATQNIKSNPSRLSLAYIKIDNLQKINTLYGYKNGDKIISKIAKTFQSDIKPNYTLARLFGSDFVLLMPDTSLELASKVGIKFLETIRTNSFINVKVTCSIGVGEYNYGDDYEAFIHKVEKLMKDVEKDGGDMIAGISN